MKIIEEFVDRTFNKSNVNIAVVGDSMLDEYYEVAVERISPEYPIPVMKSDNYQKRAFPGGAANVYYQFKNFSVNPFLLSILGINYTAALETALEEYRMNTNYSSKKYFFSQVQNPIKKRFYQGNAHVARWDVEHYNYNLEDFKLLECQKELLNNIKLINDLDVVIFSDYSKGVFYGESIKTDFCDATKNYIRLIDPKDGDPSQWQGSSKDVFKPNSIEARKLTGKKNILDQLSTLEKMTGMSVVITQGADGVHYIQNGNIGCVKNNKPSADVNSVIGAGDCFMAFLAMALSKNFNLEESITIAFQAGSQYVKAKHNKPLYPINLFSSKFVPAEVLSKRDFSLVFTNGCFDLLHHGHLNTLEFAKNKGDKLVVAVNSNESVSRLKGNSRPIQPLEVRMNALAALELVDYVVSFDEDTPLSIIEKTQPDFLVKGADYDIKDVIGNQIVKEVYLAPYLKDVSTTKILDFIV